MASIYEQSIHLQQLLDGISDNDSGKKLIQNVGLAEINCRWHSSIMRAAHATDAYFINDGLTIESRINLMQKFGEVILKGHVPRVDCIDILGRQTIALPFFDAVILGPRQEIEAALVDYELEDTDTVLPLDIPLTRPIYTPVESLKFITPAA